MFNIYDTNYSLYIYKLYTVTPAFRYTNISETSTPYRNHIISVLIQLYTEHPS